MRRIALVTALLGPPLFTGLVIILTSLQYDFLLSLGWDPVHDPTHDWPSGLSLGPYGGWMIAGFILCGFSMLLFALALRSLLKPSLFARLGIVLVSVAGVALMGESFLTDPLSRPGPHTWHGILHDAFFVLLGITLMPGMLALGRAFQQDTRWSSLAGYTWATAALALPTFFLKGIFFYIFLGAILLWSEVAALRLWALKK